jgi:8-oxo-dGTP pyrophosphatase MutT (NUDIX family)
MSLGELDNLEPKLVEKVVAYIICNNQLAVFIHLEDKNPVYDSGLQVPAGTVKSGEDPEVAVLREAFEESGLEDLKIIRKLGISEYDFRPNKNEIHRRHFFQLSYQGVQISSWDHMETDGGESKAKPFRFSWIDIGDGHSLVAGFGAMLSGVKVER